MNMPYNKKAKNKGRAAEKTSVGTAKKLTGNKFSQMLLPSK